MTAPTGEYTARASVRLTGDTTINQRSGLGWDDADGGTPNFFLVLMRWSSSDSVCYQHSGLAADCDTTKVASSEEFIQLEAHSHGDGVFDFYVYTDPSTNTKVAVRTNQDNTSRGHSRLVLSLVGQGAVSAEFDWIEVEVPTAPHNCDVNAECVNTVGSFTCTCKEGFFGDGVSCSASLATIPPPDIGRGDSWTKDNSVTFSGYYTMFKNHKGQTCPGQYRAGKNINHFQDGGTGAGVYAFNSAEFPPSGAFDGTPGTAVGSSGFCSDGMGSIANSGTDSGSDAIVELVLLVPCPMKISKYMMELRADCCTEQGISKASVYGSSDLDGTGRWTEIGSHSGETTWAIGEKKEFSADGSLGPFLAFKFVLQKISQGADGHVSIGDIQLGSSEITDLCIAGSNNCDEDAQCMNTGSSFTCTCNLGFTGDGTFCTPVILIPPSDIGRGDTWTKDTAVTSNSVYTVYKDYGGVTCPGRFRARSNTEWLYGSSSTSSFHLEEWPCCVMGGISKAVVSGSNDDGSTWTEIGSHDGETSWGLGEKKTFSTDSSLGPFRSFKFALVKSSSSTTNSNLVAGDIELHARVWTGKEGTWAGWPSLGEETNAFFAVVECTPIPPIDILAVVKSFILQHCNTSGAVQHMAHFPCLLVCVSACLSAESTLIPPADIGTGNTWVTDSSVTYGGFSTFYKTYSGDVCPGVYRVRSSHEWLSSWPPSGAFDRLPGQSLQGFHTSGTVADTGTSSGSDANVELILQTPCSMRLSSYGMRLRADGNHAAVGISKASVYGSNDLLTWTELGSYSGETSWTQGETKTFSADDTLGAFTYFKFVLKKVSQTGDAHVSIGDIELYASSWSSSTPGSAAVIPPADISTGGGWRKDPSVTYGGLPTMSTEYAGALCPGEFRAMTNTEWYENGGWFSFATDEWPVSGAFDRRGSGHRAKSGFITAAVVTNSGTGSGTDANVELILKTPCSLNVLACALQARSDTTADQQMVSKGIVYGSTEGSSWTQIGSFSGETGWTQSEVRTFTADDSNLGPFNYVKFDFQKVEKSTDAQVAVGDIKLVCSSVQDLCLSGSHNCDANAQCENSGSSFTCSCNSGFTGDGVSSCSALTLIPPSDIGRGGTWTKDRSQKYSALHTLQKDYAGSVCPGIYRAMSDTAWSGDGGAFIFGTSEWPPSGAFDGGVGALESFSSFQSEGSVLNSGTTVSSADASLELVIQIPCKISLEAFGVQARPDTLYHAQEQTPSKMSVYGSTDGSTWTQVGSFSGEIGWTAGETRIFSADSSLGPFTYFKFVVQKVSKELDGAVSVGDLKLYASGWTPDAGAFRFPPADIGTGSSWARDTGTSWEGFHTHTQTSTNAACAGTYRAGSSEDWWGRTGGGAYGTNEWFPQGAFDHQPGISNGGTGWSSTPSGCGDTTDCPHMLLLETPCNVYATHFGVMARNDSDASKTSPTAMTLHGSSDSGSTWTEISSFSGESGWTQGETRVFGAGSGTTAGPFNWFRFSLKRIEDPSYLGGVLAVGELILYGDVDFCGSGTHNCDSNAACSNADGSFSCSCIFGFSGSGISCSALTVLPPSDIGRGETWTKDGTHLYEGIYTLNKEYTGTACPGKYIAKTNTAWTLDAGVAGGFDTWERPQSGAFDRVSVLTTDTVGQAGFLTDTAVSGTSAASDANVQVVLELPCSATLHGYAIEEWASSSSLSKNPSKVTVSGGDCTGSWTELGAFSGEVGWTAGETKTFRADSTLGSFNCFLFTGKRVSGSADDSLGFGDI
uniref:EGF-like domain-containing protein n=1 Tax=Chromera velia CCMP2878 TaxID=1169474 RepID=A0A0G4GSL1_9ALVE|eukprot:Cvel_23216.t1-p1 / transcript=Cvel_23216.t1 / gene=Cvel_23216 / organism=Chromera_velia_CCMP2878 / gene_product=Cell wall protein AWA1, putative / transcript_product=Cell wall protein AWA1, putative / location=Cvel_scaffold2367:18697-28336(-) / protein_length=1757 / sequence_SO=supercontig / SO=protein_coding / is_pseudo=false